ncbi:NADPH-cytochrome P450 reductase [Trichophyton equinum CBS 127.97]|uniref:NADPH--cytochrome P450 reductase n=1 Tax=Trichophyton equinum (strain ATCC MYA-4606 / CBS 127.97) TaxID=559882 RepID=F2PHC2_TRIEC|nr:NADPH-cytochrome P450 reductase [Trichophyton equinum CBS 127.97]
MAQVDTLDMLVLAVILVGTIAYFTKGKYWAVVKDPYASSYAATNSAKQGQTRNIVEKLEETGKNCVIFYGSQTGTAEDYASRLAKEGSQRFGLKTMVADLEDYDYACLDKFPEDKVAFFVLATYGEGEPTDNAVEFFQFITGDDASFEDGGSPEDQPLSKMRYVAFGLGNNTYEHYNAMVRIVDKALTKCGAKRIDPCEALAEEMALKRESCLRTYLSASLKRGLEHRSEMSYLGGATLLTSRVEAGLTRHTRLSPIVESRELFSVKDRNCLHMEFDIKGSQLNYQTGDHIAIWPTNAGQEVDRFLKVFGLEEKRHTVIRVKPIDVTAKVPFPQPTTYDSVVRYYIETCGPVSRQFISQLAAFAPDEETKKKMIRIGEDKDIFSDKVSAFYYNIAQALQSFTDKPFTAVPFSLLIEGIPKIQPRYYSISSSSSVQKEKISITAVVESLRVPGASHVVKGVTTNYLLALKQKQHGEPNPDPFGLTYAISGPRNKYDGFHVPVHVRHSNFKLPSDPSKPIIMVGPGTGVAPFRGFIQERVHQAEKGETVGPTILFYGCRKSTEDFLYKEEFEEVSKKLGDSFKLITAFSRETSQKVYVQHRLKEHAELVSDLLSKKANFYVCGDAANMAREVNVVLGQILAEQRGLKPEKGEELVKHMRNTGSYQEDVWS